MAVGTSVINVAILGDSKNFQRSLTGAQTRLQKFSSAAKLAFAGAAIAGGKMAIDIGGDIETMRNNIIAGTGASGDALDGLIDSARSVATDVPDSFDDVSRALADVSTNFGTTGKELEEQTQLFLDFARVAGTDVSQAITIADSALTVFGENNADEALGDLLRVAQQTGRPLDELLGSVEKFGPVFANMGFSLEETTALMGGLEQAGIDVTRISPGLNKFARDIAAAGGEPRKALEETVAAIQAVTSDTEALNLATQAFGAEGAQRLSAAIRSGNFDLENFGNLLGDGTGLVAEQADGMLTLSDRFAVLTNRLKVRLMPAIEAVLEGVQTIVEAFSSLPGGLELAAVAMAAFVVASGPIGQIALAVGGLLYVVGKMGEESKKAAKRQERLTNEFKAADDPASTMIDRMKEMADAIKDVGDESDGLDKRFDTLIGSQTALSMAMDNEVLGAFDRLELSMDHVALAAKGGTDLFQDLQNTYQDFGPDVEELREHLVGLEGAEAAVATRLIDAMEAGTITRDEFLKMIDVVDETADAFDDQRAALQKNAEEFVKSADAVKLLNNSNVDGVKLLAEWEEAGVGYVQQAKMISAITLDLTGKTDNFSVEAKRAGIETRILADEMDEAAPIADGLETSMFQVERVMATSAETARTLAEAFEELMSSVIFEGEALNNTKNLMTEFDDILAEMAEGAVPDLEGALYDMATQAAAQIGELHDAGIELGSPEMTSAAEAFIADIDAIAAAAQVPNDELAHIKRTLMEMSGMVVPITIRMQTEKLPGFVPETFTGTGFVGATGGIVTQPTFALIGEAGPEAVVPLNQAPGASPLNQGGFGSGGDINVTVNMPPGSDGADVVAALQRYARAHGGTVPILTGQL